MLTYLLGLEYSNYDSNKESIKSLNDRSWIIIAIRLYNIMSTSKEYRIVNVNNLNIRKGPSTSYDTISSISKGTKVEIIPNPDNWSVINYNDRLGYVSNLYLSNVESTEKPSVTTVKIVNTDRLNFRYGPSTSQAIIGVILKNTQVEVISQSNGWSKILYNNQSGYVSSVYLSDKISNESNSNTSSNTANQIVSYAKTLLGKQYVWGAQGPNTFDCSGFTSYVFKNAAKISIPRTSSAQGDYGSYVEKKDLKIADLIFFDTVGANNKKITHVAIYIGDNQFIHASSGQGKVVISDLNMNYYTKAYVLSRRVIK